MRRMIKVLFFLPTLGNGGAERVLINLVNNMDRKKFSITVITIFNCGENRDLLATDIKYQYCLKRYYKGIAKIMKFISPKLLHNLFIREKYDIEVAYLEGIATRIISGCNNSKTKIVSWVHTEFINKAFASRIYRNCNETQNCYKHYDYIVCVSEQVKQRFCELFSVDEKKVGVQYNTNDSDRIIELSSEDIDDCYFNEDETNIIAVGKIIENKGFDRLARVQKQLRSDGIATHIYIIGVGEEQSKIEKYLNDNELVGTFTFLGYKKNPYKYIKKCDMFVCSSYREGFSTATTEALIVGTPVVTVNVSGMCELLGNNNEFGIVVENDEQCLYEAIKDITINKEKLNYYSKKALERGNHFNKSVTVLETENLLEKIVKTA